MLLYRVCNGNEAFNQEVGTNWRRPQNAPEAWHQDTPGLYATLFPEVWRRCLNAAPEALASGNVWDHTLLLEVPDDIEERTDHGFAGMEYRLDLPHLAIIRGIAGPEWPLPDWVPQPSNKQHWDPQSRAYWDVRAYSWTPRGVPPSELWYHPSQPAQKERISKQLRRKIVQNVLAKILE